MYTHTHTRTYTIYYIMFVHIRMYKRDIHLCVYTLRASYVYIIIIVVVSRTVFPRLLFSHFIIRTIYVCLSYMYTRIVVCETSGQGRPKYGDRKNIISRRFILPPQPPRDVQYDRRSCRVYRAR